MNIGFDADKAFSSGNESGIYSRNVIRSLTTHFREEQYVLFSKKKGKYPIQDFAHKEAHILTERPKGWFNNLFPGYFKAVGLGKYVSKHKIDVFHGIGGYMPASFPPEVKALRVISVISTAPLRYPDETNFIKNFRNGFQALRSVTRSSHFIVNSEQDRLFMQEKFRIRDSKLHVVHPALHPQFLSPEAIEPDHSNAFHYLPKRFILCTAKIKNSKEAEALIRAAYLDKNNEGLPIIFAARSHKGSENAKSLVKNLNIENKVLFVEGVSTGMMLFLFRRAELFLYPCKYETSAVPLFEAMACNIPVVASDIPVFRQYCGDQIHYFPDHSPEGIHHFIKQYREHQDLIRAKVVSAREHALNFSPQKFATDLMQVYRDSK